MILWAFRIWWSSAALRHAMILQRFTHFSSHILRLSCESQPGEFGVWPGCTRLVGKSEKSHFYPGWDWLVDLVAFSTEAGQHLGKPGNRITRPNDGCKGGLSIWFLQRFAGASSFGVHCFPLMWRISHMFQSIPPFQLVCGVSALEAKVIPRRKNGKVQKRAFKRPWTNLRSTLWRRNKRLVAFIDWSMVDWMVRCEDWKVWPWINLKSLQDEFSRESVISLSASSKWNLEAANSLEEVLAGPGAAALNNATIAAAKQIQLKSKQAARSQLRWGYIQDVWEFFLFKATWGNGINKLCNLFFCGFDGFRTFSFCRWSLCSMDLSRSPPIYSFPLVSTNSLWLQVTPCCWTVLNSNWKGRVQLYGCIYTEYIYNITHM